MLVLLILAVITALCYWFNLKPKGFPPGPAGFPILGSLPCIAGKNTHLHFEAMRDKYGPVIGVKLGFVNAVIVCGGKEVREVLKREEFQGRPGGVYREGIMFTEGKFWNDQRRFTVRHLKKFGFGRTSIEPIIFDELRDFFENSLQTRSRVQVNGLFNMPAVNVLWSMLGGRRCAYDDEEFKNVLKCVRKSFRSGNPTKGFEIAFPTFQRLVPRWTGFLHERETDETLRRFFQKAIEEHQDSQNEAPRDFIDVYLQEVSNSQDPNFSKDTLKEICVDLFSAGAESVGNSLSFCILYLVLYPEWQNEIFQELSSVIGTVGRPTIHDKLSLPKTEAFISEVMRINTIAPITLPHCTNTDVLFQGYFIPKRTPILVSVWSVLQDKEHWKDPQTFRPNRFLDDKGHYKKDDWLLTFGLGKRNCLGEPLASTILFLFLVSLIQEYVFTLPKDSPKPSTISLPGTTTAPQPFEVEIIRRKSF